MSTSPVSPETVPAPPGPPGPPAAPAARIRPTALAIVRRGDDLLVYQGNDPTLGETFYYTGRWAAASNLGRRPTKPSGGKCARNWPSN